MVLLLGVPRGRLPPGAQVLSAGGSVASLTAALDIGGSPRAWAPQPSTVGVQAWEPAASDGSLTAEVRCAGGSPGCML